MALILNHAIVLSLSSNNWFLRYLNLEVSPLCRSLSHSHIVVCNCSSDVLPLTCVLLIIHTTSTITSPHFNLFLTILLTVIDVSLRIVPTESALQSAHFNTLVSGSSICCLIQKTLIGVVNCLQHTCLTVLYSQSFTLALRILMVPLLHVFY